MTKAFKIRKSGNSNIATIPQEVKQALDVQEGDSIRYLIKDDKVEIVKDIPQPDIDALIEESINQYHVLMQELVEK